MYCENRLRVRQRDQQRLKKPCRSLRANQFIQLADHTTLKRRHIDVDTTFLMSCGLLGSFLFEHEILYNY